MSTETAAEAAARGMPAETEIAGVPHLSRAECGIDVVYADDSCERASTCTLVRAKFSLFDISTSSFMLYFPFPFANTVIRDEINGERGLIDDSITAFCAPSVAVHTSLLTLLLNADLPTAHVRASHDVLADAISMLNVLEHKEDVSTPRRKQIVRARIAKNVYDYKVRFEYALQKAAPRIIGALQRGDSAGAGDARCDDTASELHAAAMCAQNYVYERLRMYEYAVCTLLDVPLESRDALLTLAREPRNLPAPVRQRIDSENARFARKRSTFALVMSICAASGRIPADGVREATADDALRLLGRVPASAAMLTTRPLDAVLDMLHYMFFEPNAAAAADSGVSACE